ncbi:glycoside hydrolase family 3 protein [Jiangella anatolica]|uniref:CBM6 domain-containing protein n=1 Tax=Jiangella anatolica TaxID=2670374 RepID=A0A2W2BCJ9_9ACTN|nr:glycoside hydrolase family 3 protein [Jiangella anatolica]PZF84815.1 hypothetical protein C1I92_07040 [Jiangella anatolica]
MAPNPRPSSQSQAPGRRRWPHVDAGRRLLAVLVVPLLAAAILQAPGAGAVDAAPADGTAAADRSGGYEYPFHDPSLSPDERVRDVISRLTLDEKVALLHQFSGAIIRLGIPQFRTGTEGLHGLSWLGPATVFPQNTGLAATWNRELMADVGEVIGSETRAYNSVDARFNGVDVWGPVVDLARDPRSGRASESMGEDAFLSGVMADHMARGMQGQEDEFYYQTIPTLKHLAAYGQEAERTSYSANASPRNLYEYYFRAFRYGIESGAVNGVMTSYNLVNGKPVMTMPELRSVVYDEWVPGGYSGGSFFNVTDAASPHNLSGSNAYYPNSTLGQAASMADSIENGVAAMTPSDTDTPTTRRWIYEALARGMITEQDIDEVIYGVLLVRLHAGDLDVDPTNPYKRMNKRNALTTEASAAVAAQAAREQVVLLKNDDGILPLPASSDVALVGPLGDENSTDFYAGTYPYTTLIKDEVESKLDGGALSFSRGVDLVALKVANGTGAPAGRFVVTGATPGASLTGTGASADDANAQFYLYDYGYNNLLLRSAAHDRYVAARGPGNTLVASADPPGFQSKNRATQQWFTDQNLGLVGQADGLVSLRFVKGTEIATPDQAPNVFVDPASSNVLHNGSASSPNRRFELVTVRDGIADAVAKAEDAEVAVVAVGDQPHMTSRETFDRQSTPPGIGLAPRQEELIEAVAAANPNTVVVVVGSYPFDLRAVQANPNVKGIVYTTHAGQELGTAVADVLFGDYAPAGRLTQTWYAGLDSLPTISDYDIIKGGRTYQYHDGEILYPFGYGLTYTDFEQTGLSVSPSTVDNGSDATITTEVTVRNTGDVASDEVVQLYARYEDGGDSRVQHPIKTLVGFERVHLEPGESRAVAIDVDLSELAIWDVDAGRFHVEPGTYRLTTGTSSAEQDERATGELEVTGAPLPARDLGRVTPAHAFDDYSFTDRTATGLRADVVPTAVHEDDSYGIEVRKAGAWVEYGDANLSDDQEGIVLRAANPNPQPAPVEVWTGGPGADGVKVGTVSVPPTGHGQTFVNVGATLSGLPGGHDDLYLVFPTAGVRVAWLRLGDVDPVENGKVSVTSNHFNTTVGTSLSRFHVEVPAVVQQRQGSLLLEAGIDGTGVVDGPVSWTVTAPDGGATPLATITPSGQLTATGSGDGTVRAVATYATSSGPVSGSIDVELRNQGVPAGTEAEAVIIRSGWDSRPPDISWGPNQFTRFGAIDQYQGSLLLSAVTYPFANAARPVTFTVTDEDGNPSELATIGDASAGFVEGQTSGNNNRAYNATLRATGAGDGEVYVTATTTNGLSYTSRIVIENQENRDPYDGRYQAELFDASGNVSGAAANLRADNVHGDDVGLQLNRIRNGDYAVYRNVDFGDPELLDLTLRYVKVSSAPATIKVMADDPVDGVELGEVTLTGEHDLTSAEDYANPVYAWAETTLDLEPLSGVHDVYLVFDVAPEVPDTDISSTYGQVAGWLDLGINWFTFRGVQCDRTISGSHTRPLEVDSGVTCLTDGARVIGPVTVAAGAGLLASRSTISGPVTATDADVVDVRDSRLTGGVTVEGTTGSVTISGNRITGSVNLHDNTTLPRPIVVSGNSISGPVACTGNEPAPVDGDVPNQVVGRVTGQCADL